MWLIITLNLFNNISLRYALSSPIICIGLIFQNLLKFNEKYRLFQEHFTILFCKVFVEDSEQGVL